jgi:hypothetical protein
MKAKLVGYLYQNLPFAYGYDKEVTYDFATFDSYTSTHRALIGPVSLDIEVPDNFDPRPAIISKLRDEIEEVRADAEKKVRQIDQRIQELLAIEYTAPAPTDRNDDDIPF